MSDKFFFKGRKTPRPKYQSFGYNTKRQVKLGTPEYPLMLTVSSENRQLEIEQLVTDNNLVAKITLDLNSEENITDLDIILNKQHTITVEKTPQRNQDCPCGSGKKYKKCCQSL